MRTGIPPRNPGEGQAFAGKRPLSQLVRRAGCRTRTRKLPARSFVVSVVSTSVPGRGRHFSGSQRVLVYFSFGKLSEQSVDPFLFLKT
jgi:hypothetical protein